MYTNKLKHNGIIWDSIDNTQTWNIPDNVSKENSKTEQILISKIKCKMASLAYMTDLYIEFGSRTKNREGRNKYYSSTPSSG